MQWMSANFIHTSRNLFALYCHVALRFAQISQDLLPFHDPWFEFQHTGTSLPNSASSPELKLEEKGIHQRSFL